MRYFVGLVALSALLASPPSAHAQGSLTIEVSGAPGSNVSTWTFSGSYTAGDVSQILDFYSSFGGGNGDDALNDFQHESGELSGGIGLGATFNLEVFQFVSSTAQVSGSQSGVHLLDAIFLDSDDPITGDDLAWYAAGSFQDGETLTFSGTATITLDINLFLAAGEISRSISSDGDTNDNPADFNMTFTAVSGGPSAQLDAIVDAIEVLESGGTLSSGLAASLAAKLGEARNHVEGQPQAAAGMLTAFLQQVTALVQTGRLNLADGTSLITAAQNVIAALSVEP